LPSIVLVSETPLPRRFPSWVGVILFFFLHKLTENSGLYLTDLTFCRDGNPSHRPHPSAPDMQLINFNKYYKLARIVQGTFGFVSFQNPPIKHNGLFRYAAIPDSIYAEGDF
jgi:hypothetical protein